MSDVLEIHDFYLMVPYYEKHIFSAFLHGLSPPTGNMALLQAIQIQLLSLHKERSHFHRQASSAG